jgi:hypothetical protein
MTRELAPILSRALESGDPTELRAFVAAHRDTLTDPYEGEPLDDALDGADVHTLGDHALTRYYDASAPGGLGDAWEELAEDLSPAQRRALLGAPLGPAKNPFDPGRQGSYFQDPDAVRASLAALAGVDGVDDHVAVLRAAAAKGQGVYVTF